MHFFSYDVQWFNLNSSRYCKGDAGGFQWAKYGSSYVNHICPSDKGTYRPGLHMCEWKACIIPLAPSTVLNNGKHFSKWFYPVQFPLKLCKHCFSPVSLYICHTIIVFNIFLIWRMCVISNFYFHALSMRWDIFDIFLGCPY